MDLKKLLAKQETRFISLQEVLAKMTKPDGASCQEAAKVLFRLLSKTDEQERPQWQTVNVLDGVVTASNEVKQFALEYLKNTALYGELGEKYIPASFPSFGFKETEIIPWLEEVQMMVDWDFWKRTTEVELWQAAFLSCDIDPNSQSYRDICSFGLDNDEVSKRLRSKSNLHKGEFFSPCAISFGDSNRNRVLLPEFAAWCIHVGLPIPKQPDNMAVLTKIYVHQPTEKRNAGRSMLEEAHRTYKDNLTEARKRRSGQTARNRFYRTYSASQCAGVWFHLNPNLHY